MNHKDEYIRSKLECFSNLSHYQKDTKYSIIYVTSDFLIVSRSKNNLERMMSLGAGNIREEGEQFIKSEVTAIKLWDHLHKLADSFPPNASIFNVILNMDKTAADFLLEDKDNFVAIYGCLKRLNTWHNANISCIAKSPSTLNEKLSKLMKINVIEKIDDVLAREYWWQGKITIASREDGQYVSLAGVTLGLSSSNQSDGDKVFFKYLQDQRGIAAENISTSTTMQVLKEVQSSAIPPFYMTSYIFELDLYWMHDPTRAFINVLKDDKNVGFIARLGYDYNKASMTSVGEDLKTQFWKDSIMSSLNIPSDSCHLTHTFASYFHFLITSRTNGSVVAVLLRSPSELSVNFVRSLHPHFSLGQISEQVASTTRSSLPVIDPDLVDVLQDISRLEVDLLKEWIEIQRIEDPSYQLSERKLYLFISDLLKTLLSQFSNCTDSESKLDSVSGADTNCEHHCVVDIKHSAEYHALVLRENRDRPQSRKLSQDSIPLSSPFHYDDVSNDSTKTLSPNPLSLFNKNGSIAFPDKCQAVKYKKNAKYFSRSSSELEDLIALQWPFCQKIQCPGVYYNNSIEAERLEAHLSKLRDSKIPKETATSLGETGLDFYSKKKCQRLTRRQKVTSDSQLSSADGHQSFFGVSSNAAAKRRRFGSSSAKDVAATSQDAETSREMKIKRSKRHEQKLMDVVESVLQSAGLTSSDVIYSSCVKKLFQTTKLIVMDLPTSQNLRYEMNKIAKSQVKQVIYIAKQKQKNHRKISSG